MNAWLSILSIQIIEDCIIILLKKRSHDLLLLLPVSENNTKGPEIELITTQVVSRQGFGIVKV